jgi:hypothetical protein
MRDEQHPRNQQYKIPPIFGYPPSVINYIYIFFKSFISGDPFFFSQRAMSLLHRDNSDYFKPKRLEMEYKCKGYTFWDSNFLIVGSHLIYVCQNV